MKGKYSVSSMVDVNDRDSGRLLAAGLTWMCTGLTEVAAAQWAWIRQNGPLLTGEEWDDVQGPPGGYWGRARVLRRTRRKHFSSIALAEGVESWLAKEFVGTVPERIYVGIYRLDSEGLSYRYEDQDKGLVFNSSVEGSEDDSAKAKMSSTLLLEQGDGTAHSSGPSASDRLVGQMAKTCEIVDAPFGLIGHHRTQNANVAGLEDYIGWSRVASVAEARRKLRSYAWVTVIPAELATKLGGVEALTESGLFYRVQPFASGAVLIRATRDFAEYRKRKLSPNP